MTAAVLTLVAPIENPRLYAVNPTGLQLAMARAQLALLADQYYREVIDPDEADRWLTLYSPLPIGDALDAFGRLVNVVADLDALDGSDLRPAIKDDVRDRFAEDHAARLAEIVPGGEQ